MKSNLQLKNLRHKFSWLLCLVVLLCTANAWAADCESTSVAANTTIYVDASYVSGDFSNVYLSLVTDTNKGKAGSIKNGDVSGMSGYKPSQDTWNFKTKTSKSDNVYTFKITSAQTIYGIAVWSGDLSSYGDIWQTNVSATCEFVAGGTYTIMPDKTYHNDRKSYGYTGTWESFSPCDGYTVPTEVLNGTNIMFYVEGQYDGDACITNGSSKATIGTSTKIESKKAAINVTRSEIPDNVYVTNNCGNWVGTGSISKSKIKAGGYYKYDGSRKDDPKTLETFSPSSASITEGTASVNITVKGASEKSAYAGQDFKLYSIIYVDDDRDGCIAVSTSDQTYTLNTSSLTQGTYTVQSVLTDGHIYYLDESFTLTVTSACTTPTATQYPMTNATKTYGSVTAPIITPASDAGTVKKTYYTGINGTSYNKSETLPTNAGTYKVTVDVNAGTTYCAKDGIELTGNFVINKANQAELTLSSSASSACVAGGSITFLTTGGSGGGAVTYAITSGTGGSISGNTLTATQAGTFTVQATKAASTNYNAKTSNEVTVTFVAIPATPNATDISVCSGEDATFNATSASGASIDWYDVASGGTLLKENSNNYVVANLTVAKTVYAEAHNLTTGCVSAARKAVAATIKGATLTVSPSSVSTNPYAVTTLTATSTPAASVTWSTTTGYLVDENNKKSDAPVANSVKVKPGETGGNVTATVVSGGCTTNTIVPVTVSDDTQDCQ